jgi:hypothetical protein
MNVSGFYLWNSSATHFTSYYDTCLKSRGILTTRFRDRRCERQVYIMHFN